MTSLINSLFRTTSAITALLLLSTLGFAQATTNNSDVVLKAMEDELQRSISKLVIQGQEKPYFIEYEAMDVKSFTATAAFGGVVYAQRNQARAMTVDVRVGNYEFDNEPRSYPISVAIEDDYNALRHELWLATDAAYRGAVEQIARKRAFLKNRVDDEKIPDFSKEEATVLLLAPQTLTFDQKQWETTVRELSALFRQYPVIKDSRVTLQTQLVQRYLVNSEGTRIRRPMIMISLEASAAAQTADGMWVNLATPFYATSFEQLPSVAEMTKAIKQMAEQVTKLQAAPVIDENYLGPVLFTGPASAEMFAQLLAPEFCSYRPPVGMQGEDRSELANRLNRRVLPFHISVYDDPTQEKFGDKALLGSYKVDDQGVAARKISLVEQGVLKNLLLSRRPRKNMLRSTGHGRSGLNGGASTEIGNLFIQSSDGKSYDQLKQELLKMCKALEMPYGIIVKGGSLNDPALTYKVYVEDGREELIRGVSMGELTVKQLKAQIIAVGNDSYVLNRAGGGSYGGGGVSTSVIAPSVLLEELELKKPTGAQQKPMLLTHPYFDKP
ncbi:MAG TPA: metallopeptidase TldD-related protein [Blastocatellia bacterium]|nr:metallopeptidase TldD-related protein [Blastocatellia bacterium]